MAKTPAKKPKPERMPDPDVRKAYVNRALSAPGRKAYQTKG